MCGIVGLHLKNPGLQPRLGELLTEMLGGDAGDALGDSLYEAVIYVAGKIASLGSDARIEELTESDVRAVKALAELGGAAFGHVQPENVTRVASARGLYNFDALKDQKY